MGIDLGSAAGALGLSGGALLLLIGIFAAWHLDRRLCRVEDHVNTIRYFLTGRHGHDVGPAE